MSMGGRMGQMICETCAHYEDDGTYSGTCCLRWHWTSAVASCADWTEDDEISVELAEMMVEWWDSLE